MASPEQNKGLMKWAKGRKTATMEKDLEGNEGIDDPKALAVWLRKKALSPAEFEKHRSGKK